MTSKDFTHWLKGYFAALGEVGPSMADVETIKKTLSEVKDPMGYSYSNPPRLTNFHKMPTPIDHSNDPIEPYAYPYAGSTINYSSTYSSDKIEENDALDKELDK